MEDNIYWKTTFDGRQPSMEDDLQWKRTFDGRQPSIEDGLQWKTTFDGRRPSMEDDIFRQIRLNHSGVVGEELWDLEPLCHDAKPYSYFAAHSALRNFFDGIP